MIHTVTLNPALDKTVTVADFRAGAVNRVSELRSDAGGKGINVSRALLRLGGESIAYALLGGATGERIRAALDELSIRCEIVPVPGETRTNLKIADPVHGTTTDVNEPGAPVPADCFSALLARLLARVTAGDLVILSGSLPKGAPPTLYAEWIRAVREKGAEVLLDSDGEPLREAYAARPALCKPNTEELSRLLGRPLPDLPTRAAALRELLGAGCRRVLLTMGGEGAMLAGEGRVLYAPSPAVTVRSTVGAGDCTAAALALAHLARESLPDALRFCVAVGSAAVALPGTDAPTPDAVRALISSVQVKEF